MIKVDAKKDIAEYSGKPYEVFEEYGVATAMIVEMLEQKFPKRVIRKKLRELVDLFTEEKDD